MAMPEQNAPEAIALKLYFEPGLAEEAAFLRGATGQIFHTDVLLSEGEKREYYKPNTLVGGFEIYEHVGKEGEIVLTHKDLFVSGATSAHDDYMYGYASDSGLFYFSVARLRSRDDTPCPDLQINRPQYEKRLCYIVVHELGHWFVKDQRHYEKYFYTNPATGHKQDNGWHCTQDGCVMRAVDDLAMLDARATSEPAFCATCAKSLRTVSGMPVLPS